MKIITEKGKVVSLSFKNLAKKSFSLKGLFNKAKEIVTNLGKAVKKLIVKGSAYVIVYVDKLVERIHKKIDNAEFWLYKKLSEKFGYIPEEVLEVIEEIVEEIIE